ncbi:MAG TPA: anthranilate phosphoribosyltransferase [Bacteroidia bacterium]|jgi:anthranilate phosphoribosyltransferase|nr:anthranilate phosphoribosyltransferase [Bacteroidia bacterium]
MKKYLKKLYESQTLTKQEAREVLLLISEGKANAAEAASLLTVYLMRPISVEELGGYRDVLLELCVPVNIEIPSIDVCGTGGDSKNTFNISTLSAFVAAACGVKVAKHGNYGVSSVSGSSNVLEYLGYKFSNNVDSLKKQLDKHNICFMHAPLFHPALKHVAPVRKEMGVKTFFNMLGPLVNPARTSHKMVGVYNLELARVYHYLLQDENQSYCIVHSLDGYDEISGTSDFKVYTQKGEQLTSPSEFGLPAISEESLFGGDTVEAAAKIFTDILQNKGTKEQTEVLAINTAYAMHCYSNKPVPECLGEAREVIRSGKVFHSFTNLINNQ